MNLQIQYITDEKGKKQSVIIPFKQWEKFEGEYRLLVNKLEVMAGIQEGVQEVKYARKNGKKLQSLVDFLNEG